MPRNNPAQHALLTQTLYGFATGIAASQALILSSLDGHELALLETDAISCKAALGELQQFIAIENSRRAQIAQDYAEAHS